MKTSSLIGHVVELFGELAGSQRPPDALIASFFRGRRYLGSNDRRFIAETFYGVLRHHRLCDHILEQSGDLLTDITPEGRSFFRIAAYLLAVETSPRISQKDLRSFLPPDQDDPRIRTGLKAISSYERSALSELPPAIRWSFPDWMVEAFSREYGDAAVQKLLPALNEQAPLTVRANTLKTTADQCKTRLASEGVTSIACQLVPDGLILTKRMNAFSLGSFRDGWFEVQDEGSQLLAALADPKPTDRVLDLCAGAGGKTLAMSAWMKNRGEITATDISERRLKELRRRMRRAGADNIRIQENYLEKDSEDQFDLVFVDAPCTGVGTIRRNPGMKWSVTEEMIDELSAKQREIIKKAASYVLPGGLLVYATCSLFREENEHVVEGFLSERPDFTYDTMDRMAGEGRKVFADGSFRLTPHEDHTDGFYCAFLRRSSEA